MEEDSSEAEGLLHRRPDNSITDGQGEGGGADDDADRAKASTRDPSHVLRGDAAAVHPLALEACDADSPAWVACFTWTAKALMTLGLAPSLWHTASAPKDAEHTSQSSRARDALVDLFSIPNLAIASHYWNVGLAMSFLSTPVSFYLVDTLDASAAVTNTYSAITYLPWCLKVFVGLVSDSVPIHRQHRKPYFVLGWGVTVGSCLWLACYPEPSVAQIQVLSFTMVMGYLVADTVADALVVERSVYETRANLGGLRTEAYIVRSVGGIGGAVLGALLYNSGSWGWGLTIAQCFLLQALVVLVTLAPAAPWLLDIGGG
jgi:hypothetical protein